MKRLINLLGHLNRIASGLFLNVHCHSSGSVNFGIEFRFTCCIAYLSNIFKINIASIKTGNNNIFNHITFCKFALYPQRIIGLSHFNITCRHIYVLSLQNTANLLNGKIVSLHFPGIYIDIDLAAGYTGKRNRAHSFYSVQRIYYFFIKYFLEACITLFCSDSKIDYRHHICIEFNNCRLFTIIRQITFYQAQSTPDIIRSLVEVCSIFKIHEYD